MLIVLFQIIEETQNTLPIDDLPTQIPPPTKRLRKSHPGQIPPQHRSSHIPSHRLLPPHSHMQSPLTTQHRVQTTGGHTPLPPQLHRASYPAAAAADGPSTPAATAASAHTPGGASSSGEAAGSEIAAVRRSLDDRSQGGTGDTSATAAGGYYDGGQITDSQSLAATSQNVRDPDSDNSMEGGKFC